MHGVGAEFVWFNFPVCCELIPLMTENTLVRKHGIVYKVESTEMGQRTCILKISFVLQNDNFDALVIC